jgi:hypothetical protein
MARETHLAGEVSKSGGTSRLVRTGSVSGEPWPATIVANGRVALAAAATWAAHLRMRAISRGGSSVGTAYATKSPASKLWLPSRNSVRHPPAWRTITMSCSRVVSEIPRWRSAFARAALAARTESARAASISSSATGPFFPTLAAAQPDQDMLKS